MEDLRGPRTDRPADGDPLALARPKSGAAADGRDRVFELESPRRLLHRLAAFEAWGPPGGGASEESPCCRPPTCAGYSGRRTGTPSRACAWPAGRRFSFAVELDGPRGDLCQPAIIPSKVDLLPQPEGPTKDHEISRSATVEVDPLDHLHVAERTFWTPFSLSVACVPSVHLTRAEGEARAPNLPLAHPAEKIRIGAIAMAEAGESLAPEQAFRRRVKEAMKTLVSGAACGGRTCRLRLHGRPRSRTWKCRQQRTSRRCLRHRPKRHSG